jgi:hypothetical protein
MALGHGARGPQPVDRAATPALDRQAQVLSLCQFAAASAASDLFMVLHGVQAFFRVRKH